VRPTRTRLGGVVLAIAVAVPLVFAASLFTGWLNPLFDDAVHRYGEGADFYPVPQAAQNIADGVSISAAPASRAANRSSRSSPRR
jgi:hypothetical protein